jgi:hypothetical protein
VAGLLAIVRWIAWTLDRIIALDEAGKRDRDAVLAPPGISVDKRLDER